MGILNIFNKPFKDVHDGIKSYERFHKKIEKAIEEYINNTKVITNETDQLFLIGIKEIYLLLKDSGLDLDNIIYNHIENGKDKKLSQFATKMQKHSVVTVTNEFVKNKNIELVSFPEISAKDVSNYAEKMLSYYKDYKETERKIAELETLVSAGLDNQLNIKMFDTMLLLNQQNLVLFKSKFAKEAIQTNRMLEKSLCFLSLPHELNEDTIRIHAYLRKLLDFEIISSKQVFKRFTSNIPSVLDSYKDELGYFELNEEQTDILFELKKKSA